MTQGRQTRELNYVDDTVQGLLLSAVTPAVLGSIINVGGGEELSVRSIAERIFRVVGADQDLLRFGVLPERAGEVSRFFCDATRCRTILGHRPEVSLDEGLSRTIEWARGQGWATEVLRGESTP